VSMAMEMPNEGLDAFTIRRNPLVRHRRILALRTHHEGRARPAKEVGLGDRRRSTEGSPERSWLPRR
jgi:hypothetical protein